MGSDTGRVAGEYHGRVAFFPLDPTATVPQPDRLKRPADVYLLGGKPGPDAVREKTIRRRPLESPEGNTTRIDSGVSWRYTKAATLVEDRLYSVTSDGMLWKRSFDDGTPGPKAQIDLHGLQTSQTGFPNITSLFYSRGYLYFTEKGRDGLYRRAFTVEDDVLGAEEQTVSPNRDVVSWNRLGGAFLVGRHLYYSDRFNGSLRSLRWAGSQPVPGTLRILSSPAIDGLRWEARGLVAAHHDAP